MVFGTLIGIGSLRHAVLRAADLGFSRRAIARLAGLSPSTVINLAAGSQARFTVNSRERIQIVLESLPGRERRTARTVTDSAALFTPPGIANLRPPAGSRAFKLTFHDDGKEYRYSSSGWFDTSSFGVLDALADMAVAPEDLASVIWDTAGG